METERVGSIQGRVVLCVVILATAGIGLLISIATGKVDSAMVFVGLPTLLALACALSPPARSVHGLVFKGVSIGLLMAAVLLHEGAICVVLAAPLVYAVAHITAALIRPNNRRAFAVVPLALLVGVEGLAPGARINPDQAVTVTHATPLPVAEVAAHLAAGPDLAGTPKPLLLAIMPLPGHVSGTGLAVGDRWVFAFHGDSHGPGGVLVTEVVRHEVSATGGIVEFRTISDTSVVTRWLDWTSAQIEWHASGTGTTVALTMNFTRALDPSWYFGPVESVLVRASAHLMLDAMGLPG